MSADSDGSPERRRRTLPLWGEQFAWWTNAVKSRLATRGINQKQLAQAIGEDEGAVSRCITRHTAVYEILMAISDELEVPYPVILPESEAEAAHLTAQRRLLRSDAQLAMIKASSPTQPTLATPPNGVPTKRRRRRV